MNFFGITQKKETASDTNKRISVVRSCIKLTKWKPGYGSETVGCLSGKVKLQLKFERTTIFYLLVFNLHVKVLLIISEEKYLLEVSKTLLPRKNTLMMTVEIFLFDKFEFQNITRRIAYEIRS